MDVMTVSANDDEGDDGWKTKPRPKDARTDG